MSVSYTDTAALLFVSRPWSMQTAFGWCRLVSTINHERVPVLLTREEEFEVWLKGSADEAFALTRECPSEQMRIVREDFDKEDPVMAN